MNHKITISQYQFLFEFKINLFIFNLFLLFKSFSFKFFDSVFTPLPKTFSLFFPRLLKLLLFDLTVSIIGSIGKLFPWHQRAVKLSLGSLVW